MRFLLLTILVLLLGLFANAYATSSTVFTPFDLSLSDNDFTTSGPNHEILIINKNQTATINILISNKDSTPHQISLEIPYHENLSNVLESFSFDTSTITVLPNSQENVLMHLKTKPNTDVGFSSIQILAKSDSFGMKGKSFFLVIGDKNNVTENDLEFVDHSLREAFPGPAFSGLYLPSGSFEQPNDANPSDKLGIPKYIPKGYSFQGFTNGFSGLVYAPVKITNTTEAADFSRSGGLYVGYEGTNSNFNLDEWMSGYVGQNEAEEILVNGLSGTLTQQEERVTTEGYKYKFPAQIVLFDESSEVYLSGNMPVGELLKVAESIAMPDSEESETMGKNNGTKSSQEEKDKIQKEFGKLSPLKQFKSGTDPYFVNCRQDLELIIKLKDNTPACVKSTSLERLLKQGWIYAHDNNGKYQREEDLQNTVNIEPLNHFPNIDHRELTVTIDENNFPDYALLVTIQDKVIQEKPHETIMFQKIGIESDRSLSMPQYFFMVTNDSNQTDIVKLIQDKIESDVMIAGPNKETLGFDFPIEIPLTNTAKPNVVIFNYSDNLILPIHDKTYHIKLTSFFPVQINLPKSAMILQNDTRAYTEFWYFVKDDNAYSHKSNLFPMVYDYRNPPININQVIVYELLFKMDS